MNIDEGFTPRWQEHEILISLICSLSLFLSTLTPHLTPSACEAAMEVSDQYHRVLLHVEDHRQICSTGEMIVVFEKKINKRKFER